MVPYAKCDAATGDGALNARRTRRALSNDNSVMMHARPPIPAAAPCVSGVRAMVRVGCAVWLVTPRAEWKRGAEAGHWAGTRNNGRTKGRRKRRKKRG